MAALTLGLLALSAAGTASTAIGQRRAGKAAAAQGNYEGDILEQNAKIADAQATDALARGDESVSRSRAGSRQLTGSQRAAFAAQGIDIGSGSAGDVISNDETLGEFDAITLKQNAQREAWGFKVQATNDRAQGNLARMGGRNSAASLNNASVGTLLSGAGDLMNLYSAYGRNSAGGAAAKRANDALDKRGVGSLIKATPNRGTY